MVLGFISTGLCWRPNTGAGGYRQTTGCSHRSLDSSLSSQPVYTVSVCAGLWINFIWFARVICWSPLCPFQNSLSLVLISCSSCPVLVVRADLEWLAQLSVLCRHGLVFFLPTRTCACSVQVYHTMLLPLISVIIWPGIMLKPLKPNSFWSLPSLSFLFSSLCLLLPSILLFSLLNCKYQVPFILFCYFCYYCYYIVVLVIFFSLVDRCSSSRTVYPQSQSVNMISFQSLVQEGKTEQNVSFLFSLPSFLSSQLSLFTIIAVITVLFIVLCWGAGGGVFWNWGIFFLFSFNSGF